MKTFLLFTFLFLSIKSSFAVDFGKLEDWEIIKTEQDFYLKLRNEKKIMADIQGFGQDPKLEKVECAHNLKLCYVIYYAGEIGTQRMIKVWRAVIFDYSTGFFEGDFPYKYLDGDRAFPQPEYIMNGNSLTIKDETSGIEEVLNLSGKR